MKRRVLQLQLFTHYLLIMRTKDALKALVNAHDKPLRGRNLVVTYANQAPMHENVGSGPGNHHKRGETQRRTTLSLLKSTSLSKK